MEVCHDNDQDNDRDTRQGGPWLGGQDSRQNHRHQGSANQNAC